MPILSSYTLLLWVLLLSIIEINYTKNIFSPFTVTAWPYAIISILVNTFAVSIGFLPVSVRANFFILLNLSLVWITGLIIYVLGSKKSYQPTDYANVFGKYDKYQGAIYLVAWTIIAVVLVKIFLILSQNGLWYIGTDDYENLMIVGLVAHLIQVAKILLILLVLISWNHKKGFLYYVTVIMLSLIIISIKVKYHIVWVILILFFIKNISRPLEIQSKNLIKIFAFVIVIFFLNYLAMFYTLDYFALTNKNMWQYILGLFYNYTMSGPILLDSWLDLANTKPWWSMLIVFINAKNVIVGDPLRLNAVDFVSPGFMRVSSEHLSNVGTSFGVYVLIGGITFTILMTIVIAAISYYFYYHSRGSKNPISIFLNAVFLTMGFLSFFVQYFTLLSLYEMFIFFCIFILIFEIFNKLNPQRKSA